MNKFVTFGSILASLGLLGCSGDYKDIYDVNELNKMASNAACAVGETKGADLYSDASGIVNGKTLTQDSSITSRVVLLVFKQTQGVGICTGTLYSNNIILTAAHCTADKPELMRVIFKSSANCIGDEDDAKKSILPVIDMRVHPSYDKQADSSKRLTNLANDVAVLKFEGTVPEGYKPLEFKFENLVPAQNEKVILTGYGVTDFNGEGDGTLRVTNVTGGLTGRLPTLPNSIVVDQTKTGVCSGDSGGPMFIVRDGKLKQIGIASAVVNADNPSKSCSGYALFLDPMMQMDFIRDSYKAMVPSAQ